LAEEVATLEAKAFREYDIRGIAGKDITDDDVIRMGRTFATYMRQQHRERIVVGRDCRLTSKSFRDRLIDGLMAGGMDVVDIGICPTPLLYFALRHLDREGGIMITASHNPPEYNGFKLCNDFATISGEEIQKLRRLMEYGNYADGPGRLSEYDIITPYTDFVLSNIRIPRTLKVGLDAGNSVGGPIALPLLEKLGCEVHPLYCDMDGTFPNHEPDPTVIDNLKDLIALVKREHLDVGIAYDGDGDRLGVVDHNGDVVFGDKLMLIFAREILTRQPGATFVSEVKCSKTLYDDIRKRGGKAIMWRTGHSLIKAKMKEVDAALAGEMSGHMFFKDRYFGFDDGLYASFRLLEILAQSGATLPELLEGVPVTFATPEIRVECPDEIKFEVVEQAKERFRAMNLDIIDVDGARIVFDDGWGLVRASNTQPVLVLRYEANTEVRLGEIRQLVEGTIEGIKNA
jgi:phosphomannomutase / phosphoglucomutase